ncbi:MAG: DUF4382 domain-containing protein, partial [Terriglobales bacterium]
AMTSLNQGTGGSNQIETPPASTVPVSLTITDDPPAGVSVLFFQVSLTAASLQPASGSAVSLLPNGTPIQIDVTQLQALSAFLSTANVPAGNYSSLSLTFASPQLVIINNSDQSIASTCAVGSVCQLTPAIDNSATVNLSSSPFPVTVAAGSPLGFLIDYHLNTIIQPDLSVNLAAVNGVTVSQLPPSAPLQPPQFGFVTGTVESVSASQTQFTVQTAWGWNFTIDTNSSTELVDWPPCASPGALSCLSAGAVVLVQIASVESNGDLLAAQVTWLQAAGQQTVVGTIVGIPPLPLPAGETMLMLILHQNPTASTNLPVGAMALVAVWAPGIGGHTATTYSIDANGFTIPSGFTFASSNDLAVGQTLQVTVAPGTLQPPTPVASPGLGVWGLPLEPIFTASSLQLEPSQLTGTVSAISSPDFTLSVASMPQCSVTNSNTIACPQFVALIPYDAVTTSQTTYQGFSTDSFSGLADNDWVSVNGWLFPASGSTSLPTIVPKTVVLHANGIF